MATYSIGQCDVSAWQVALRHEEVRTRRKRRQSRCFRWSSLAHMDSDVASTRQRDRLRRALGPRSVEAEARRRGSTQRSNELRLQKYTRGVS